MRPIGFSTGALALGDFRGALRLLEDRHTEAVELSALRDHELAPLMDALQDLDLAAFKYVSIHAPSKFKSLSEAAVAEALQPCISLDIPLVIHPDIIREPQRWASFGPLLCIENMDKRKGTGRTLAELESFFSVFPDATFCLDLAHARQIDSTMTEARLMLRRFGNRLRQVHMSELDATGHHEPLSFASVLSGQSVAALIPQDVPIIIESMVPAKDIGRELDAVQRALTARVSDVVNESSGVEYCDWGELA
jgi:hypothetical protein